MNPPLRRVVEHARPRAEGGASNVLECGHTVVFDGRRPATQRCRACPTEPAVGEYQPSLEAWSNQ